MKEFIDISVPLHPDMPVWPGSAGIKITQTSNIKRGGQSNVSCLTCDMHTGTHVDAPLHFIENGNSVEQMSLNTLIGPALVAYLPQVNVINADTLTALSFPEGMKRLLLRTRNSVLWEKSETKFRTDYVALTEDAAKWIVEHDIRLIGIDYLSIQCYHNNNETHKILLGAGIIIVEGLNLTNVAPGWYELVCLPLKLVGSEGAPARAVLRPLTNGEITYEN